MLTETLATAHLHYNRALGYARDIEPQWLNAQLFSDKEKIKTVDAFIFRFIKLQDFMGDKLFRLLLNRLGEYKDNMPLIDVLDKMEKLGFIEEAEQWLASRQLRNKLTHEYPDNQQSMLEGIELALKYFDTMASILQKISADIAARNLK